MIWLEAQCSNPGLETGSIVWESDAQAIWPMSVSFTWVYIEVKSREVYKIY